MAHKIGDTVYAGYPTATLYVEEEGKWKANRQLLWGDWMQVTGNPEGEWLPVRGRGMEEGLICRVRMNAVQATRLLEVTFVDIGQGDGALIRTPDDQHIIVDAGQANNMYRFLRWKYNFREKPVPFKFTGVISHSDSDHYKGFELLFEDPNVSFGTIYHNGIIEDTSKGGLGEMTDVDGRSYISEVVRTTKQLRDILLDEERWVKVSDSGTRTEKQYMTMLNKVLKAKRVDRIEALGTSIGKATYLPGFGEAENDLQIQVLGPVLERVGNKDMLRCFGPTPTSKKYDRGKTKNGHSVILQLRYKNVKLLLGGDLNNAAGVFLLEQYGNEGDTLPKGKEARDRVVAKAREVFGSDVAKCCHHGSHDVPDDLIRAFHAAATVISSGDRESHAHPRCDTLGVLGLHGRGERPLIFSTELSRSAKENGVTPEDLVKLQKLEEKVGSATTDEAKEKAEAAYEKHRRIFFGRGVEVYGAINFRSDGEKIVMAYRKERLNAGWDVYCLEPNKDGVLTYVAERG